MSRSARLLDLLQLLRGHRLPVSGQDLADRLGVSLRTLYRDIATLQAQGAHIEGEAGIGYVLRPGFMLPPLMFDEDEIEALVLGSRWVAGRTDGDLANAAARALAKIAAVLPASLKDNLEATNLMIGPGEDATRDRVDLSVLRRAIRREQSLDITYEDLSGKTSDRRIRPFGLGFFDRSRVVVAFCELRGDFRHFRTDRIIAVRETGERYPARRAALLKAWKEQDSGRGRMPERGPKAADKN